MNPPSPTPAQSLFRGCSVPCANCPYRKDAPLALWSRQEFRDLLEKDADPIGTTYGCHKADGSLCRGWFIDQRERDLPSIALRIALSRAGASREDVERVRPPRGVGLFKSIAEMAHANFPEDFPLPGDAGGRG